VLAVYKDQTVLRSVVDYQKQTQAALAGVDPATLSDREVVDDLLKNALLLEEAEARGLTPTQEEIEQYLQETVYTAYDNYCASAGISFEEYVADLRGQAPRFLAKAKLKEVVMEEYCQAHGLPYDRMNPPQEAQEAVEAYQDQLLADHQGEITYYLP